MSADPASQVGVSGNVSGSSRQQITCPIVSLLDLCKAFVVIVQLKMHFQDAFQEIPEGLDSALGYHGRGGNPTVSPTILVLHPQKNPRFTTDTSAWKLPRRWGYTIKELQKAASARLPVQESFGSDRRKVGSPVWSRAGLCCERRSSNVRCVFLIFVPQKE